MKFAAVLLLSSFVLGAQVKITPGPEKLGIEINGKPFTDFYVAGDVSKPALWPIRAASGTYVTRAWPLAKAEDEAAIAKPDHPHQRGLWFGHASVNHLDFWNIAPLDQKPYNQPDRGKIVLHKMGEVKSGKDKGSIAATFDWQDHDGKTLLTESRVMTFYADKDLRTIDFDITLTAATQVTFGDEKDGLFGIRIRPVLQEDKGTGHMVNAEGAMGEKAVWGKPSNWCDYSGEIAGEKVGIAILDHPGNPGHPVRWHTRGYGLFAANPFAHHAMDKTLPETPTVVEPGKSLRFRYRVIIHPGDAKTADIAKEWAKYTK